MGALSNAIFKAKARAQADREDMHAALVTIGAQTIQAGVTLGPLSLERNETSQSREVQTGSVTIRKQLLNECPAVGRNLVINGESFRVENNGLPEIQASPVWRLAVKRIVS